MTKLKRVWFLRNHTKVQYTGLVAGVRDGKLLVRYARPLNTFHAPSFMGEEIRFPQTVLVSREDILPSGKLRFPESWDQDSAYALKHVPFKSTFDGTLFIYHYVDDSREGMVYFSLPVEEAQLIFEGFPPLENFLYHSTVTGTVTGEIAFYILRDGVRFNVVYKE